MTAAFGPFRFGHHSHPGPRESNQDTVLSIGLPDDRWLLAVADGMGGLEEGELASKTALGALYRSLLAGAGLEEAVQEANAAVHRKAEGRVMGSTLVAAVMSGRSAEIVHVGDSRAYASDLLGLIQLTEDHTMAAEALRDGTMSALDVSESSARWAGSLARYLGSGTDVQPDRYGPVDLVEGGWLLLCSDGLHGVMALEDVEALLMEQTDAQEAAEKLVEEALARNTGDNVSVVLARWYASSEAPASPTPEFPVSAAPPAPRAGRSSDGRVLIQSGRGRPRKKGRKLVILLLFVLVPLMIALVLLLNRILSPLS